MNCYRLKKISASCVDSAGKNIYLGTENGNVYIMDVEKFEMLDSVIYVDVIMQKYAREIKRPILIYSLYYDKVFNIVFQ